MNSKNPFPETDFFPELTPLIDVMFLLLVFFMLTTTFERDQQQKNIPIELPQAKQSYPVFKDQAIVLSVKEDGEYFVEGNPCAFDALSDVLKIALDKTHDSVVVISGHKNAPYGRIVYIYDVLQSLGIQYFSHEVK